MFATLSAQADPASVADLVGRTWFEGLPVEQAALLSDADGRWLAGQLADSSAESQHGNIAMALGACGCGPAFEALSAFARAHQAATTGAAPKKALRALPQAMGLLARHDPRALAWLQARARVPTAASDGREQRRIYALVLQGLAQSGSAGAGAQLLEIEARAMSNGDEAAARWAQQALRRWRQNR